MENTAQKAIVGMAMLLILGSLVWLIWWLDGRNPHRQQQRTPAQAKMRLA
jgi:uncharacterized membrane protein YsdA (DUF1294 family)